MASSEDPNKGRNRVPMKSEIDALLKVAEHNRRLANGVEKELFTAREAHDKVQRLYNQRVQELDGTKSELNATYRIVGLLERQYAALDAEHQEIKGLVHPVRQCPDEVLRYIFQLADEMDHEDECYMKTAYKISSVCRRWRGISLKTPSLWKDINISLDSSQAEVQSRVQRTAERIGLESPKIFLYTINNRYDENLIERFMNVFQINRFKSIELLMLRVPLEHLWLFSYTTGPLRLLDVHLANKEVDLSHIFNIFPTIEGLELQHAAWLSLDSISPYSSLKFLKLADVSFEVFSWPWRHFPNLTELELENIHDIGEDILSNVLLNNLTKLKASGRGYFPWNSLYSKTRDTCPRPPRRRVCRRVCLSSRLYSKPGRGFGVE